MSDKQSEVEKVPPVAWMGGVPIALVPVMAMTAATLFSCGFAISKILLWYGAAYGLPTPPWNVCAAGYMIVRIFVPTKHEKRAETLTETFSEFAARVTAIWIVVLFLWLAR